MTQTRQTTFVDTGLGRRPRSFGAAIAQLRPTVPRSWLFVIFRPVDVTLREPAASVEPSVKEGDPTTGIRVCQVIRPTLEAQIDPSGVRTRGMRGRIEGLQLLIDQARRDWVAEQLRFGQFCRASAAPVTRDLPISYLGEHARLTPEHLRRAVQWNARSGRLRVTLPGGQVLPTGAASPGRTRRIPLRPSTFLRRHPTNISSGCCSFLQ